MPRRFLSRRTSTKKSVKHSGTFLDNVGNSGGPETFIILKTGGGPRSIDGSPQTIQSFLSTDEDCKTADIVKLVNLHLQCGPRQNVNASDREGWMEWALILVRENETAMPSTRLGVQTVGDVATNMYRGECIFTGNMPVGGEQPGSQEISLKIPKSKQHIKLGDEWRWVTNFRCTESTSVNTGAVRLIKSYNYLVKS